MLHGTTQTISQHVGIDQEYSIIYIFQIIAHKPNKHCGLKALPPASQSAVNQALRENPPSGKGTISCSRVYLTFDMVTVKSSWSKMM